MIATKEKRYWWPLNLSPVEENAFSQFRHQMSQVSLRANPKHIEEMAEYLAYLMKNHLPTIIERDGLPHSCHVVNGWGNVTYKGHQILESLDSFVHRNNSGEYFVLQCDPEGDFHPWQTFAYAVMAGVDPNQKLSIRHSFTLKTLAKSSRAINTSEGRELGHLLFALAYLDPDLYGTPFLLKNTQYTVKQLFELGIDAHHHGTFEVCRKFHLTEGLCAAATHIPGLESYKVSAQGFLDGQLDMLLLLGIMLQEARKYDELKKPLEKESLLLQLRETLRIGNFIENHCYYAGHLIELACFAQSLNYTIKTEHWNAMAFIIDELNSTLKTYIPYMSFLDSYLALGHYRRSITLYNKILENISHNKELDRSDLEEYTINFDLLPDKNLKLNTSAQKPLSVTNNGIYDISNTVRVPRKEFLATISHYSTIASKFLKPRGQFDHFRRIGPPTWPRAFHYELLDYGDQIGIEIHLESASVLPMREHVKKLTTLVSERFPDHTVEWDSSWYHDYGRLRLVFNNDTSPQYIALHTKDFIQMTFPHLDDLAKGLQVNPIDLGEFTT